MVIFISKLCDRVGLGDYPPPPPKKNTESQEKKRKKKIKLI